MSSWSQQAQQNKYDTWNSSTPSQQQQKQQSGGFVLHQNGREGEAQRLFPVVHAVHKTPQHNISHPEDVMAPQSISFIGDEDTNEDMDEADNFQTPRKSDLSYRKQFNQMDDLEVSLGKLNITSGSRTYRIPSPTTRNHPGLAANSFQSMESQDNDAENEKGFYISFDNDPQPKRPKPPLRKNRSSPKKPSEDQNNSRFEPQEVISKKVYDVQESYKPVVSERLSNNYERPRTSEGTKESQALIIGNDKETLDPVS